MRVSYIGGMALHDVRRYMNIPRHKESLEQTAERFPAPALVAAPNIARRLSVTPRYVLQMAEQERIPCVRLGRKCVRFSPDAVAKALGIEWEGATR